MNSSYTYKPSEYIFPIPVQYLTLAVLTWLSFPQQYRGWGVETASERLAEIYSKQAELWEQVSRRSSLQALSLASASPRFAILFKVTYQYFKMSELFLSAEQQHILSAK